MHSLGYAHLDIKLENILLDEFFNIKLADMGICENVAQTMGYSHRRKGTVNYMAPEVVSLTKNDTYSAFAADVYSLGVTIYIMLTGEFPTPQGIQINLMTGESDSGTTVSGIDMESSETMKSE